MSVADWHPDPTGRHDSRRRNADGTWTDEVADSGVLSRDPYDGTQPEPAAPPEPAPEPEPVAATDTHLPTIAAAVQQIQRWTGWLLAVVAVAGGVVLRRCLRWTRRTRTDPGHHPIRRLDDSRIASRNASGYGEQWT